MNKIKLLPPHEAQKIAAGEVLERPAHAVKELVENALDAHATKITLYVEKAGKKKIRIIDDGYGMTVDDALLCIHPHATSKISSLDDLQSIATFGFRGEALASIAAISKLHIKTRGNGQLGSHLQFEGGTLLRNEQTSCPQGTEFIIEDLFYNTPVRKKFLKQDETEWNQIISIFQAFCLSNLNVHFTLYHDDSLIINAPPVADVKDRVIQLWDYNLAQNLIPLSGLEKSIEYHTVQGYISHVQFWRYNRQQIFFFVNNRFVKNVELSKSLLAGYRNVLPPARFPAAFIFITVAADLVDVNVHPKKEEVRFAKQTVLLNAFESQIKVSLEKQVQKQVAIKPEGSELQPRNQSFENQYRNSAPVHTQPATFSRYSPFDTLDSFVEAKISTPKTSSQTVSIPPQSSTPSPELQSPFFPSNPNQVDLSQNSKIIGQFLNTYILIENKDGLVMIDQHAAHERILYEKMLKNFEKKEGTRLLFPEIITMPPEQIELLLGERAFFSNQGIEFIQFGVNQISVTASPSYIANQSLKDLILQAAIFIEENEQLEKELFRKKLNEHMHSHLACKTAIRAGDSLDFAQMTQLINDLSNTNDRFRCIHGRPTVWFLPEYEIAKKFRRK